MPIVFDYNDAPWNLNVISLERLIAALGYPGRVCRTSQKNSDQISEALDVSFPVLDSPKLYNMGGLKSVLLVTSLTASIQSLRHLPLDGARLATLLPIL
jgi:hypothetical protein